MPQRKETLQEYQKQYSSFVTYIYKLLIIGVLCRPTESRHLRTLSSSTSNSLYLCKNEGDLAIWYNEDSSVFANHIRDYSMSCIFSSDSLKCVADKFISNQHYSVGCSTCMGELSQCTQTNCLLICFTGDDIKCNTCVKEKCSPLFNKCSGL